MTALIQDLNDLSPNDLRKLGNFLMLWSDFQQNDGELSEQQLQVIMQNLHTKELVRLAIHKGGAYVEFTGGGFEYERFLIRTDGRMPNNRYEAKKVSA
jgi:hypothetical protein